MIRALAVDIDGTLTDKSRAICPVSVEIIRKLKAPVILTTGNTHCFTRTACILLGLKKVFIAENGGVVSYADDELEFLADVKVCERAYDELGRVFDLKKHDSRYRFTDIALVRNFDVKKAQRYADEHDLSVDLIDTRYAVHIKERGVDKGTGLVRIAARLGLDLREFAAIGDSLSDIPMFRLAGFRACVGNSDDALKAVSDYVSEDGYGPGFADIIRHMKDQRII